jgi:hypothetical protein
MADYDFQCRQCNSQFDGDVFHDKPENCPYCAAPKSEIEDAEVAQERQAKNDAINAEDDYLEDMSFFESEDEE